MFLAWAEIWQNKLRFGFIVVIIALLTTLLLSLSALANGLGEANIGALKKMVVDYVLLEKDVKFSLTRSFIDKKVTAATGKIPGVKNSYSVGYSIVSAKIKGKGKAFDASLFGVEKNSPGMPPVYSGRTIKDKKREAIADSSLIRKHDLRLGDKIIVKTTSNKEITIKIVGISDKRSYWHFPAIFIPLDEWQEVNNFGDDSPKQNNLISAVLIKADSQIKADDITKGLEKEGVDNVDVADHKTAYQSTTGYKEEQSAIKAEQSLMWVIGTIIIGTFFYALTLQNLPQIAVLKALGASRGFIIRTLFMQSLFVAVLGVSIGILLTYLFSLIIPPTIPIHFEPSALLSTVIALLVMGPLGGVFSVMRLSKIDPMQVLNSS